MIFNMKRQILLRALTFGVAASALILTSCSTTETRISNHPEIFQTLSPRDQALVREGKIREGMSQDAVWVAWGTPDQKERAPRVAAPWKRGFTTNTPMPMRPIRIPYGPFGYGGYFGGRRGVSPSSPPSLRYHWRSFLRSLLLLIHSAQRGVSGQDGHVFQWPGCLDPDSDSAALLTARAREEGPCRAMAEARCSVDGLQLLSAIRRCAGKSG